MRYRIHEEANMWTEMQAMPEGEAVMSLDRWSIALNIEMIQWADLLDRIDNLIYRIEAQPDHGEIDYAGLPCGLIDT